MTLSKALAEYDIDAKGQVHWNLASAHLIEQAVRRGEGSFSAEGSFVAVTAPHTGGSPNDKFIVREPSSEDKIGWGGPNVEISQEHYELLRRDLTGYVGARRVSVQDRFGGSARECRHQGGVVSS